VSARAIGTRAMIAERTYHGMMAGPLQRRADLHNRMVVSGSANDMLVFSVTCTSHAITYDRIWNDSATARPVASRHI